MGKWIASGFKQWAGEKREIESAKTGIFKASFPQRLGLRAMHATRMQHVRRITQHTCIVETPAIPHTRLRVICARGLKGLIVSYRTEEIVREDRLTCRVSPARPDDDHEASSMAFLRPLPRQFHMSPRAAWSVAGAAALSGTHTHTHMHTATLVAIVVLSLRDGDSLL